MDLESDVWGWGTGTDAMTGFQSNSFMGVGFLMTMVDLVGHRGISGRRTSPPV